MIFWLRLMPRIDFGFSEFFLTPNPNQQYSDLVPPHSEGRCATSRTQGGMRWTRAARLTGDAARGRRRRVVLTPRRWRQVLEKQASWGRGWQESPVTRESAEETVKTIARGMPGDSGATCG